MHAYLYTCCILLIGGCKLKKEFRVSIIVIDDVTNYGLNLRR